MDIKFKDFLRGHGGHNENTPESNNGRQEIKVADNTEEAREEYYDILHKWRGNEYEYYGIGPRFYWVAIISLSALVIYALVVNNPIMAITFILVGVAGYLYFQRVPREVDFLITTEGIIYGNQLYEFENIKSFWIFYEPPIIKNISLKIKDSIFPFVNIPIHEEDPVKIREILLNYISEKEQEPTLTDAFERFVHFF